jgi:type II secretory pathway component PulJ
VIAMVISALILFIGARFAPAVAVDKRAAQVHAG